MKIISQLLLFCCVATISFAQAQPLDTLQEATVLANWANQNTPMAFNNVTKATLQKNNFGQDLPYLLQQLPSVVASSDAGTGIGYTGLRVRGTDATRINVTINGVPVNDSESHAVYWVNMPDLASSVGSVQLQRGVGTSTNGAGAFGATLNLNTNQTNLLPYAKSSATVGSFGTRKGTLQFGSGLINEHWSVDARFSRLHSDGYIQRATANLGSWYGSLAYVADKTSVRLNVWSGNEVTYHAWNGVPFQYGKDAVLRRTNTAGTEKSGVPYENQIDNYKQSHLQLIVNQVINKNTSINLTAHGTLGKGYYEEYKKAQSLNQYILDTIGTASDIVRQRWLDNQFVGAIGSITYNHDKLSWVSGFAVNQYIGNHFGQLVWAKTSAVPLENWKYYNERATKRDASAYTKANYELSPKLNFYADVQFRQVNYRFFERESKLSTPTKQTFEVNHSFFNPKAGFLYSIDNQQSAFASFAVANKEPIRSDYKDAPQGKLPLHETLYDTELGYTLRKSSFVFQFNAYNMAYRNQLAVTGAINENSQPIRINVPSSVRRGVELQLDGRINAYIMYGLNVAFSQNKIKTFTEYYDHWDIGTQEKVELKQTNLALSPNVVAGATLSFLPFAHAEHIFKNMEFSFISKYVGKQYLDNTSDDVAALAAYFVQDLRLRVAHITKKKYTFECNFLLNNAWNTQYSNNGWSYRFQSDAYNPIPDDASAVAGRSANIYNLIGLYPQAGRNFLLEFKVGI